MPLEKYNTIDEILNKAKGIIDPISYKYVEDMINLMIRYVLFRISNKYGVAEKEFAAQKIQGNLINFIALVVMQLTAFGEGKNTGPFLDLCDEVLRNPNDRTDSSDC